MLQVALKMSTKPSTSSTVNTAVAKSLGDSANVGAISGSQHKPTSSAKPLSSFDKSVAKAIGGKLKLKISSASNSGIQKVPTGPLFVGKEIEIKSTGSSLDDRTKKKHDRHCMHT